jgi:hypothetical protein
MPQSKYWANRVFAHCGVEARPTGTSSAADLGSDATTRSAPPGILVGLDEPESRTPTVAGSHYQRT